MTSTRKHDPAKYAEFADLDGAELLHQVRQALARYVILPDPESMVGVVLWIAASHAVPAWAHAPRLVIRAPEKRCGKSRLLDLVEAQTHRPLMTVNASPSAVYRSIGQWADDPPTLLMDEADTIFGPKAGENEDLRGLLNAGHQRGRPALRYNAAADKVQPIETFAMAALAGIGTMPDTIEDRAVVVRMRRRAHGESVAPYRARRDRPALDDLRDRLHGWIRAHLDHLGAATPAMPVEDRAADTWEPLVAVADLAGDPWPDLARDAAVLLTESKEANAEQSIQARLLADCRTAFGDAEALPTADLLDRLKRDPEAPWATWGHTGLTAMRLGNLLREFDISPGEYRFATGKARGYRRTAFTDAWARYCPTVYDPKPRQPRQPRRDDVSAGQDMVLPVAASEIEPRQSRDTQHRAATAATKPRQAKRGSDQGKHSTVAAVAAVAASPPPTGQTTLRLAVCIACREPLSHDDGTHTHPTCDIQEASR